LAVGWFPRRLCPICLRRPRTKAVGLLQALKWEQRWHWCGISEQWQPALVHDWGFRRLCEDEHLATVKIEGNNKRVEQHWRPWRWLWRLVWRYTSVHKSQQTLANRRGRATAAQMAASLRVNTLIGQVNLKHESLRHDPNRQAPSTTPHRMHKPATQQAKPQPHAQGPLARQEFMRQKSNPWRPTSAAAPEPPTTCGTHGRPSTSIQFAAAAGKPCGVDTGCFRTAEPSTDENQTISASQEPHTCWRTFHPLIKGDEEMSWSCFTDSMQSAMLL
jgi:hypothetical protein